MNAIKGFWKHTENGSVYAIQSTFYGDLLGADGPLDPCELGDLDSYEYGQRIMIWIRRAIAEGKLRRFNPETNNLKRAEPNGSG